MIASIVALIEMFYLLFQVKEQWTSCFLGMFVLVVIYVWLFLWKGIEIQLEANLFLGLVYWVQSSFGEIFNVY